MLLLPLPKRRHWIGSVIGAGHFTSEWGRMPMLGSEMLHHIIVGSRGGHLVLYLVELSAGGKALRCTLNVTSRFSDRWPFQIGIPRGLYHKSETAQSFHKATIWGTQWYFLGNRAKKKGFWKVEGKGQEGQSISLKRASRLRSVIAELAKSKQRCLDILLQQRILRMDIMSNTRLIWYFYVSGCCYVAGGEYGQHLRHDIVAEGISAQDASHHLTCVPYGGPEELSTQMLLSK
ncbi:hypothetical protein QBC37DRAFT_481175 [Rhypophila decipiens]|uniref:Uncharacterized protein n=1 Tax=Rhypophila decipiens TaxID=261697 RepID=A0AAN6YBZ0_9PEZI|nr:hypothetical protein QBC37DRAFT_481175 [Rhypophila decipiens]